MRITGTKVAIMLCMMLSAAVSTAQSLGDVARQDRARKSQLTQHATVITNDELQQERILPTVKSENQPVVFHASATDEATPMTNTPVEQPAVAWVSANTPRWEVADQPGFSLGAYARALRQERTRREQKNSAMKRAAGKITNESMVEMLSATSEVKSAEKSKNENQPAPATEFQVATTQPIEPKQQPPQITDAGRPLIRASRGDSLWKLARIHLGDGRLWPVLWESNPEIRNPQRLVIGQLLRLSVQELNFARVKMNYNHAKVVTTKRNTVQPNTTTRTASAPQMNPMMGSTVQSFDVARYLPARISIWAAAGLATFVKPSAYPTR